MKILSWNVNGLKAFVKNGGLEFIKDKDPDIICLQEIKHNKEMIIDDTYNHYWNFGDRAGYSGTALFSKIKPISVTLIDEEGRGILAEYDNFMIFNIYFPNSQRNLERLEYRLNFDKKIENMIKKITKPVILCGDCNISQTIKDIAEPKKHLRHPGYTIEERNSFASLLTECKMCDVYRTKYANEQQYTFWSYLGKNKERNIGYRCDLFCLHANIYEYVTDIIQHTDVRYSDHCPVILHLEKIRKNPSTII